MSRLVIKGRDLKTIIAEIQTLSDQLDDELILVQRVYGDRTTATSPTAEFLLPVSPPGIIDLARIGTSILSVTITPKHVNNILRFRCKANVVAGANFEIVIALVAPASAAVFKVAVNGHQTLKGKTELFHIQTAGSTVAQTFHLHIGLNNAGGGQPANLVDDFSPGSEPLAFIEIEEFTE